MHWARNIQMTHLRVCEADMAHPPLPGFFAISNERGRQYTESPRTLKAAGEGSPAKQKPLHVNPCHNACPHDEARSLARSRLQTTLRLYDNRRTIPTGKKDPIMETPLLDTPPDNAAHSFVPLGYLAAYDAPLNCDFAFLAYKETDKDSGNWRVRIRSTQTEGAVFESPLIAKKARETGAQGKPFFLWGYKLEPSAADPRHIEFRVYQEGGQPKELEIFVRLRQFDQSPDTPQSLRVPWPA